MVASAKFGNAIFANNSGTRSVQFRVSDVNGELATWDSGNGATTTSQTSYYAKADGYLIDICATAAPTDTTQFMVLIDDIQTGNRQLWALQIAAVTNRPPMKIPVRAGQRVSIIQLT